MRDSLRKWRNVARWLNKNKRIERIIWPAYCTRNGRAKTYIEMKYINKNYVKQLTSEISAAISREKNKLSRMK